MLLNNLKPSAKSNVLDLGLGVIRMLVQGQRMGVEVGGEGWPWGGMWTTGMRARKVAVRQGGKGGSQHVGRWLRGLRISRVRWCVVGGWVLR